MNTENKHITCTSAWASLAALTAILFCCLPLRLQAQFPGFQFGGEWRDIGDHDFFLDFLLSRRTGAKTA